MQQRGFYYPFKDLSCSLSVQFIQFVQSHSHIYNILTSKGFIAELYM